MRQGVLGLLLARHCPETDPRLSSITSSKSFLYLVFLFFSLSTERDHVPQEDVSTLVNQLLDPNVLTSQR